MIISRIKEEIITGGREVVHCFNQSLAARLLVLLPRCVCLWLKAVFDTFVWLSSLTPDHLTGVLITLVEIISRISSTPIPSVELFGENVKNHSPFIETKGGKKHHFSEEFSTSRVTIPGNLELRPTGPAGAPATGEKGWLCWRARFILFLLFNLILIF